MTNIKKEMDFVVEKQKKITDWEPVVPSEVWDTSDIKDVEGVLIRKDQVKSKFGQMQWLYELECGVGNDKIVYGSKILDDKMRKVQIGDYIKIQYLGKKRNKQGTNSYHEYEVMRPKGWNDLKREDVY